MLRRAYWLEKWLARPEHAPQCISQAIKYQVLDEPKMTYIDWPQGTQLAGVYWPKDENLQDEY